jgi:hypothetical protein
MGRVESTATVAVEQAQLIDPSAFRFDTSIARATQQAGAVIEELGKRKIEAQDRISTSNANAAISKAQLDYQQDIIGKPLDQHAGILLKHVNNAKSIAGQQKMSKQARELSDARLNAWGQTFAEQGELATVVAMHREAGIRVASDLGDALVNGDAEDIAEAEIAFDRHHAASPEEGKQQKEKIEALAVKQMRVNSIGIAAKNAFAAWESTVSIENPKGDLNAAFESIENSDLPEDEKQEVETEIKTRVANRRAERKLQLEANQEQDLSSINQLMYFDKDYSAASEAIKNSSLTETQKTTLLKDSESRANAVARGIPIKNDRVVENELYEMSLDIWRGTITKKQFDDELIKRGGKLDDPAYQRVTKSAADTLKTSQAQSLARADSDAANVLVNFKSEDAYAKFLSDAIKGLDPDASKLFEDNANEVRQLQFNNLTQYNAEARQWVADNPDKTGKDFFQFSEALKHEYWNKNIDDLRELRAKQNESLGEGVSPPVLDIQIEGPPAPITVSTQDQYDNLPPNTEYIDVNGNRGTKR